MTPVVELLLSRCHWWMQLFTKQHQNLALNQSNGGWGLFKHPGAITEAHQHPIEATFANINVRVFSTSSVKLGCLMCSWSFSVFSCRETKDWKEKFSLVYNLYVIVYLAHRKLGSDRIWEILRPVNTNIVILLYQDSLRRSCVCEERLHVLTENESYWLPRSSSAPSGEWVCWGLGSEWIQIPKDKEEES